MPVSWTEKNAEECDTNVRGMDKNARETEDKCDAIVCFTLFVSHVPLETNMGIRGVAICVE